MSGLDLVKVDRLIAKPDDQDVPKPTQGLRVLDVGSGPDSNAKRYWPDATVLTLDADPDTNPDVLGDLFHVPEPDASFDRILLSHVLEHVEYKRATDALTEMARLLAPGGELHVFVPSLEWAARQILSEKMSPATIMHIYGLQSTPWQYHKAGFTLMALRGVVSASGLNVAVARRAIYKIVGSDAQGKPYEFEAEQHYVVGVKPHAESTGTQAETNG